MSKSFHLSADLKTVVTRLFIDGTFKEEAELAVVGLPPAAPFIGRKGVL